MVCGSSRTNPKLISNCRCSEMSIYQLIVPPVPGSLISSRAAMIKLKRPSLIHSNTSAWHRLSLSCHRRITPSISVEIFNSMSLLSMSFNRCSSWGREVGYGVDIIDQHHQQISTRHDDIQLYSILNLLYHCNQIKGIEKCIQSGQQSCCDSLTMNLLDLIIFGGIMHGYI